MSEIEILRNIKADPSHFLMLFKLYFKAIFGYIFRRTGNFDDTADIAADTFTKAFQHIGNFHYMGISIKNRLCRIATNEAHMYFRQRQKFGTLFHRMDIELNNDFYHALHKDKREMEVELRKHEQYLEVLQALKKLPTKYQEVVAWRYFERKHIKEIAEILDIKEGTIKSLLARGMQLLRHQCNKSKTCALLIVEMENFENTLSTCHCMI